MALIVISSATPIVGESAIINDLFNAGLQCLHIRKPHCDVQTVRRLIDGISPQFHHLISLHQYHQIAPEYNIKRLHYTEFERRASMRKNVAAQKSGGYILSTSVHLNDALPALSDFNYTFFGPLFNSISKRGYNSAITEDFKLIKNHNSSKIVGLGGINIENLPKVKAMNFDGAAVLGIIWSQPQFALQNFGALQKQVLGN